MPSKLTWPDLYFGPVNLWSGPYLGRKYEEIQISHREVSSVPFVPKLKQEVAIKKLIGKR